MGLMSVEEYKESIRDDRVVYVVGRGSRALSRIPCSRLA